MDELSGLFEINETNSFALSYSRISDFDRNGPKALNKQREKLTGEGVRIGSLVDDLLLNHSNFNKLYFVFDGEKPTATLGKLCDIITNNYRGTLSRKTILKIIKKNNFWSKWSDDKIKEAFDIPEFWNYIKAVFKSKRKTLVTTPDMELAKALVHTLKTHEHSKYIINNNLENIHQFVFNIEYKNFVLRGIIDKIIIDHKTKTVRLIDLKTGKGTGKEFISSFIKWRYYLQEAVYMKAFKEICKILNLEGYTLLPFQFLYIGRSEKIPFLFTVTKDWHKAALRGFFTSTGYKYKGLDELISEIQWHLDNKIFNMSKEVYEANGSLLLDDSFIYLDN